MWGAQEAMGAKERHSAVWEVAEASRRRSRTLWLNEARNGAAPPKVESPNPQQYGMK